MDHAVDILRRMWENSTARLRERLPGLTDVEYFWEPAQPCWTVRRDASAPSGWQIDYDYPTPVPPPMTTIAWRLVHIANGNWIRWEHAFGPGARMFPDLPVPGSAAAAITYWDSSQRPIQEWLHQASDPDLDDVRPTPEGEPRPAGHTVTILLDEQIHHGAEIGVLRDLYAGTRT